MNRVAIYTRVSSQMQVDTGNSLSSQKEALTNYAERAGWEVIDYYTDEGLSGKNMDRPEFQRLLEDADKNLFDVVLVWRISRLSRSIIDLNSTITHFLKRDISFVSYSENFDVGTPTGKLMFNILGSIAEFDRETIAENVAFGKMGAAHRGKRTFPHLLGFTISEEENYVIDKKKARIVRSLFKLYLKEQNLSKVVEIANKRGYTSFFDRTFKVPSVRVILTNPAYCGYARYKGKIVFKEKIITPLINEEEFDKVQLIIRERSKKFGKKGWKVKTISEWLEQP